MEYHEELTTERTSFQAIISRLRLYIFYERLTISFITTFVPVKHNISLNDTQHTRCIVNGIKITTISIQCKVLCNDKFRIEMILVVWYCSQWNARRNFSTWNRYTLKIISDIRTTQKNRNRTDSNSWQTYRLFPLCSTGQAKLGEIGWFPMCLLP